MLTVKFLKYGDPPGCGGHSPNQEFYEHRIGQAPMTTEAVVLHPAKAVFVELSDKHGRQVVGVQNPVNDEIERFTIGSWERRDVMFNVAYVMNDAGKTVETIRG